MMVHCNAFLLLFFYITMTTTSSHVTGDMWHAQACIDTMTDGCSSPLPLRENPLVDRYDGVFIDSCNRHDVCYECVSVFFLCK